MPQVATPVPHPNVRGSLGNARATALVSWAIRRARITDLRARLRTLTDCVRSVCRSRVVSRPIVGSLSPSFWMTVGLSAVTATLQPGGHDLVDDLLRNPSVQSARSAIRALEPQTIDTQVLLCEIPAPPFGEARRANA